MSSILLDALFMAGRLFEPVYVRVMRARSALYRTGLKKTGRAGVPVISVGNLLMGGTGKTPHVIAICRYLQSSGRKPAVVTRGYGGRAGKGPLVVSDRSGIKATVRSAGDEPLMMAEQMPGIPVVAGSYRYGGAETAVRDHGADTIVLDDGFQHIALHRDLDIVLIPAIRPMGNGHLFPAGELRESPAALNRAHCIIITGCEQVPDAETELLRRELHETTPSVPVFTSRNRPAGLRMISNTVQDTVISGMFPSGIKLFAICAIGTPDFFYNMLEQNEFLICGTMAFRDHHFYTLSDLKRIYHTASESGADAIVTTAKDGVKLTLLTDKAGDNRWGSMPVYVLEMEAAPEKGFWRHVDSAVKPDAFCADDPGNIHEIT